jgi:hypothetical protein
MCVHDAHTHYVRACPHLHTIPPIPPPRYPHPAPTQFLPQRPPLTKTKNHSTANQEKGENAEPTKRPGANRRRAGLPILAAGVARHRGATRSRALVELHCARRPCMPLTLRRAGRSAWAPRATSRTGVCDASGAGVAGDVWWPTWILRRASGCWLKNRLRTRSPPPTMRTALTATARC